MAREDGCGRRSLRRTAWERDDVGIVGSRFGREIWWHPLRFARCATRGEGERVGRTPRVQDKDQKRAMEGCVCACSGNAGASFVRTFSKFAGFPSPIRYSSVQRKKGGKRHWFGIIAAGISLLVLGPRSGLLFPFNLYCQLVLSLSSATTAPTSKRLWEATTSARCARRRLRGLSMLRGICVLVSGLLFPAYIGWPSWSAGLWSYFGS